MVENTECWGKESLNNCLYTFAKNFEVDDKVLKSSL